MSKLNPCLRQLKMKLLPSKITEITFLKRNGKAGCVSH